MTTPYEIERAGRVRRWHSNPDMCHVVDTVAEHSGRMARLLILLHSGPSMRLLRAALTHDDGEALPGPGDVSGCVKSGNPKLAELLAAMEAEARFDLWGMDPELTGSETLWLKYVDRLDAYMMVERHRPDILGRDGWPEAQQWLQDTADVLGVSL